MKNNLIYLNGKIIPESEARVSCLDPGFLYGQGLFETMRAYEGVAFQLDNHLARLLKSLPKIKIDTKYSAGQLKKTVISTLKANKLSNAYIRLNIWQGQDKVNVSVVATDFSGYTKEAYDKGFSAKIVKYRQNEDSLLSGIKSFNYLQFYLSRLEVEGQGFDEALFLNSKGEITEGSRSNIFLVKNNKIITPNLKSGCLNGITRQVVINLAKKEKLNIAQQDILPQDLHNSDEAFLTNSLIEVMPLTSVDGKPIGNGNPGSITLSLLAAYRKRIKTK